MLVNILSTVPASAFAFLQGFVWQANFAFQVKTERSPSGILSGSGAVAQLQLPTVSSRNAARSRYACYSWRSAETRTMTSTVASIPDCQPSSHQR